MESIKSNVPDIKFSAVVMVFAAWVHGVTVGVAHGHESLVQFFALTFVTVGISVVAWNSEAGKRVAAAFMYFMTISFVMCFVSSITWFRNPKVTPLPDLIHDLVPPLTDTKVPYMGGLTLNAFPEMIIGVIVGITVIFIAASKHRSFILRRVFVIYASLMALRCVCILITSLPDPHPACQVATPGTHEIAALDLRELVVRALVLFVPVGDHFTCGDMVFSGHTMLLMICGMVWHTYYKMVPGVFVINWVKIAIWSLIFLGLFLIVATRLHYTLDVFLAIFLTLTTWGAYHRIAHDVATGHRFVSVWMFDGMFVYPAIEWLEGDNPGAGINPSGVPMASPVAKRARGRTGFGGAASGASEADDEGDSNSDVDILGMDSDGDGDADAGAGLAPVASVTA